MITTNVNQYMMFVLRSILQERCGFYFEGVWLWRISGSSSQEMMGMPLPRVLVFEEVIA